VIPVTPRAGSRAYHERHSSIGNPAELKHRTIKKPGFQPTALIAVVMLLLILFLSAAWFLVLPSEPLSPDRQAALAELEQRRAAWLQAQPARYEYRITRRCSGCGETLEVTSTDGIVRAVFADGTARGARDLPATISIADVFGRVEQAVRQADRVAVDYHPRYRFPTQVRIDWYEETVDDEITYAIERFVALDY
jgi:hypothetical protein